jgi:hypothetical protein
MTKLSLPWNMVRMTYHQARLMLMLMLAPPASENHELIEGIRSMMEKHNDVMIEQSAQRAGESDMIAGSDTGHEG